MGFWSLQDSFLPATRDFLEANKFIVSPSHSPGIAGEIGVGTSLLVAFFAGCGNVLITNPIWVVATRMQAHQKQAKDDDKSEAGPLTVAQNVWEESGIKVKALKQSTRNIC